MLLHHIAAFVGTLADTVGDTLVFAFAQQDSAIAEVVGVGEVLVVVRSDGCWLSHAFCFYAGRLLLRSLIFPFRFAASAAFTSGYCHYAALQR